MREIEPMVESTENSVEIIKVVDRALTILDMLKDESEPSGVNEIAKQCGFPTSTTFRILKTLEQRGWVFQVSDKKYITGEKLSFVLEKNNLNLALKDVASFVMKRYSKKHNKAMNLLVREGARCYILQQSRSDSLMDYIPPLYSELPFYASSGGKVLLSELPNCLVNEIISSSKMLQLTPHTIKNAEQFRQELLKVAEQGYAIDYKESAENGSCIAVPVRDKDGNIIAAISFSGFVGLTDETALLQYVSALKNASVEISQSLFCSWEF